MKKRIICLLLTLTMILTLLPAVVLAADSHSHDVSVDCGDEAPVVFVPWDGSDMDAETDGIQLTEGSFYLEDDVTVSSEITVVGEVNLCLGGKKLQFKRQNGDHYDRVLMVEDDAELNLCDCQTNVYHGYFTGENPYTNGDWTELAEGASVPAGKVAADLVGGIIMGGVLRSENGAGVYNYGTLNMYGGNIAKNWGYCDGAGVYNEGEFNLYGGSIVGNGAKPDSGETDGKGGGVCNDGEFTMYGGKIYGNNSLSYGGGGVYNAGTFVMEDGVIDDNSTGSAGGGVYNDGEFTMNGGEITRNLLVNGGSTTGGGVYNNGEFTMEGGTIGGEDLGNIAKNGTGGGVHNDKTFTMTGGTISYNECGGGAYGGGGVCNFGNFTMTAGDISHNKTTGNGGGGVCNYAYSGSKATFLLEGGTISHNEGLYNGGGVYTGYGAVMTMTDGEISENKSNRGGGVLVYGSFTMEGGEIRGNISAVNGSGGNGGGVYVEVGNAFTMTGGTITENMAAGKGGGVYVSSGAIMVKDSPYIAGNKLGTVDADGDVTVTDQVNNVFLKKANINTVLSLLEKLNDDASVGVSKEDMTKAFTTKWLTYMTGSTPVEYFFSDDETYSIGVKSNELFLIQAVPATGVSLDKTSVQISAGKQETLVATVTPADTTDAIVWTSDNTDVATVANGVITAVADGTATINATVGAYSATCEVTVETVHEHNWSYAASGDTITATCSGEGTCDVTALTLTIVKPTMSRYNDGGNENATIKDGVTSIGGVSNLPAICYQKNNNGIYDAMTTTAPSEPGTYKASITVEGAAASVAYTIAKAENNNAMGDLTVSDETATGFKVTVAEADRSKALEYRTNGGAYVDVRLDADGSFTVTVSDDYPNIRVEVEVREKETEYTDASRTKVAVAELAAVATGTVADAEGYGLEGAEVKLLSGEDVLAQMTTGADGKYRFEMKGLSGLYTVEASKDGVSNSVGISFHTNRECYVNIGLEIGGEEPKPEPKTYTVTVTDGSGSGEYEEGERVTITAAAAPEGKQFKAWSGTEGLTFTEGSATTEMACFTMPAHSVSVRATYEDITDNEDILYNIAIAETTGGSVTCDKDTCAADETVTVTVTPEKGKTVASVTVTDENGQRVSVTDNGDGTYTFVQPEADVTVTATFKKTHATHSGGGSAWITCTDSCDICGACADPDCKAAGCAEKCRGLSMKFTDVAKSAWYAKAVQYVYHRQLMNGMSKTVFAPDAAVTRAMLVTILWNLEGQPRGSGEMNFSDVEQGTWYTEAVRWAAEENIVEGWNGKFSPMEEITREQFVTTLWRYAKYKGYDVSVGEETNILSYEDAFSISEYAVSAVQWACGAGLMQGSDNTLMPKDGATRAQTAMLLFSFCEKVAE